MSPYNCLQQVKENIHPIIYQTLSSFQMIPIKPHATLSVKVSHFNDWKYFCYNISNENNCGRLNVSEYPSYYISSLLEPLSSFLLIPIKPHATLSGKVSHFNDWKYFCYKTYQTRTYITLWITRNYWFFFFGCCHEVTEKMVFLYEYIVVTTTYITMSSLPLSIWLVLLLEQGPLKWLVISLKTSWIRKDLL